MVLNTGGATVRQRERTGVRKIDLVQVNHSQMDGTTTAKTQPGSDRANRTPGHITAQPLALRHAFSKPHPKHTNTRRYEYTFVSRRENAETTF